MKYINSLYFWTIKYSGHKNASWFLAFVSFIESSIFPIPPDIIMIPMILSNRRKAFIYALICTISSVLGGILAYFIGFFLFDTIGKFILETYNLNEGFNGFRDYYDQYGIWIVLGGGFTPFPFKLITLASGFFALNFPLFVIMSIISRGGRFFLIAILLWFYGDAIREFIEKNLGKLTIIFFLLLVGGFTLIKLF
ncbi:MAG: hypothetical protein CFH21_00489 [Alphaproteobacteria bacterium MarineAlpha5_Bin11]|nr:cytochrome B [Pelagibacteraceae bacterium]MBI29483.1 cytochrome B [Pelagibacteraceae bacterium]PPR44123.1 MAG: hypothetical protein CFH21_00489 [Alphaproteobacteria bacterium MarineAlpha5_Bin11]PPR51389.1 MAG: hypothetical protein CFH20_00582 [Alphaproteobacteria bacterium MarineAlpha5_Bin10]|tara:strand:+ start:2399 stop:2983 length:585 start_codon:yes stop_codon:yes gene_type:complete